MAYITKKTTTSGVKPIGSNLFGSCSTASGTAQKNVTMADFDVLVEGVTIHVYFENGNEADNPTLKVGSTQAMPIVDGIKAVCIRSPTIVARGIRTIYRAVAVGIHTAELNRSTTITTLAMSATVLGHTKTLRRHTWIFTELRAVTDI